MSGWRGWMQRHLGADIKSDVWAIPLALIIDWDGISIVVLCLHIEIWWCSDDH